MSPPRCSLCCTKCSGNASASSSKSHTAALQNRYEALCDFLPAGTIAIPLQSDEVGCSHTHAADGWHSLPSAAALEPVLVPDDAPLLRLRQIDFLVRHHFVAATCKLYRASNHLYVRIYLIPWDLPNVHGKLRVRDEGSIVAPARRHLHSLFAEIVQDDDAWDAVPPQDISLETWTVSLNKKHFIKDDIDARTMAEIYNELRSPKPPAKFSVDEIPYMRSKLWSYQKETVATMLAWELEPSSVADPLYIPITGIDGAVFHLQPETYEILQECPRVVQTRGGILCEELGTGKTIMTLGLILSTRSQLPSPAESILDPRPVLTPLSFRHFPTADETQARTRLLQGSSAKRRKQAAKAGPPGIPSLVEHLLHYCALREHQDALEQYGLWKPLVRNSPFYHHYEIAIPEVSRAKRKESNPGPRVMYSARRRSWWSRTTYSISGRGIMKHCHDVLRVLEVNSRKLPRAAELASNYDIILMTYNRFSLEASADKVSGLHSWNVCECTGTRGTRVPKCTCETNKDASKVSPLLQVRWKRLVIDEGHVSARKNSNLISMSRVLSVERKWIVTGTPTPNLLGLQHGQGTELQYPDDEPSAEFTDEEPSVRQWTKDDRQDLSKLSTMMSHFLGVPQFAADPKLFERLVISPLMASEGPRSGAIQVLTQVMETTMIGIGWRISRTTFCSHSEPGTVLLDLDPYALKSYNAMQAMIAVNAVDSERKDQDYLFHPANAASLNQLWTTCRNDHNAFNVEEIAGEPTNTSPTSPSAPHRSGPHPHATSSEHVRSAAGDPIWREMQKHAYVYHRRPPRVAGKDVQEEERRRLALLKMDAARKPKKSKEDDSAHRKEIETVKHVVATREKQEELRKEYLACLKKMQKSTAVVSECCTSEDASSRLLASSPMVSMRLGASTSTKLDYILHEIRQYSGNEKFLIFSRSPLTLAYVAEGLELSARSAPDAAAANIVTFETSELYRVFLMELQHGARGSCARIGQKRPVTERYEHRPTAEAHRGYRMRDFIANPTFLSEASNSRLEIDVPLFDIEPAEDDADDAGPHRAKRPTLQTGKITSPSLWTRLLA
ncbi:uncharacterized protein B0H18DRAFT_954095 [Fomitopsis serialis]|uniref:uncharacterized protein n=1 Tax=Fomitopsis serialis TaxID=139415 RepID=UPI002007B384|nr:uncharacterized protein B0H18DRAFT_954095 [Neoantrodia serialis]KAH9928097.1 hypothetical protein B0H18DRAFT_954095 [Neoantrodia serialis]